MIDVSRRAFAVGLPSTSAAVTSVLSSPLQGLDGHHAEASRLRQVLAASASCSTSTSWITYHRTYPGVGYAVRKCGAYRFVAA